MNKPIYFVFFFSVMLFAFSCNSNTETEDKKNEDRDSSVVVSEERASNAETPAENTQSVEKDETKADKQEPFSYLKELAIDNQISIKYNPSVSTVYNKKRSDLDKNDPMFYNEGGPGEEEIKAIQTKISDSGDDYYIVFTWGPSADPAFHFYKDGQFDQPAFRIAATKLYVTGTGAIYSSGHTNNMFDMRKKYKVANNNLVEVKQPYYHVGLKTKTLKPISLYSTEKLENVVAKLPANYNIEVLVQNPENRLFLITTDFGLTGWVKVESGMRGNASIDKLYYAGD